MSALNAPGQDDGLQPHPQPQDPQHLHVQQQQQQQQQQQALPDGLQQPLHNGDAVSPSVSESTRKPKAPSVRRACAACHSGKTRCSEVLPCQSCLKRGIGNTCAYPDPDAEGSQGHNAAQAQVQYAALPGYPPPPMHSLAQPSYYDYSTFQASAPSAPTSTTPTTTGASTSTFRPNKRPRNLTDEEAAAITRNFQRGAFFIGQSEPVRIDPRLPVRLTLAEGDVVHFLIGETAYQPIA
ncbi:Zn(II)2Cys6 transcription factor [Phanerochaete sordida]|uniref:Zn(II)2Cys6 transcription factor n=1 Tax=Phanerochaete sordida TaxID=48140 RepID=A0A9P3G0X3_9APHY|nr:Zn(II)2Cys6 transcription factor [Phanerochaete sordida]